jgi:lipoprotein-anchoring transpeptidase ErfK/SrfK
MPLPATPTPDAPADEQDDPSGEPLPDAPATPDTPSGVPTEPMPDEPDETPTDDGGDTPAEPAPGASDAPAVAIWTPDGAWFGVVISETLNVRQRPSLDAPIIETSRAGHLVAVYEEVAGDAVDGVPTWYRIGAEPYVSAALVDAFVPPAPHAAYDGHWVDVDLSAFYAIAYDGSIPVYAAIIRPGKAGFETPVGEFTIFSRVEYEVMDGATVGYPPGHPEYYFIPDVPHTQYFAAGGYALHGNYWTSPTEFGAPGSHGCVNLLPADAAFLWNFLTWGSAVSIHH